MDIRDFRARSWLVLIFLLAAIVLITVASHEHSPTRDVLTNISASFMFALTTLLLLIIQEKLLKRRLAQFFGRDLVKGTTHFVYPDFTLHQEVQKILTKHSTQLVFQKPVESRFRESLVHRIPVKRAVATADIQALLYVTTLFESTRESPNLFWDDGKMVDNCDTSFISFGLSSNDCTHLYLFLAANDALFTIVSDGDVSEHLRLYNGNEFSWSSKADYGIIVRYSPDPANHPNRRWFIIAGLGPSGTTGAAWFLSKYWRILLRRVGSTSNFCAVVRTPHIDFATRLVDVYRP